MKTSNYLFGKPKCILLGNLKTWTFYVFILLITTVYSCSKLDEARPAINTTTTFTPITPRSPNSFDDRLTFADFNEFKEYFLELDTLFDYDQELFDSIVIATTPVKTIHEEYVTVDEFETFLSDPVMRAIVNLNYEFQIDDVLITYITDGQILVSDASNGTAKTAIRGLTKGEPVAIGNIPSGAFWDNPKDLEEAIKIGCGCNLYIEPHGCEQIKIHGRCNNLFGGSGEGDVWVDFNPDGTFNLFRVLEEEVDGNFEFFINLSAELYENPGLFLAVADPVCVLAENRTANYYFDPEDFASCDGKNRTKSEIITNGNERMIVQTSRFENFWAYYNRAEIHSQTWNGSKWDNTKANLYVKVDANRKSINCNLLGSKDDDKSCSNCKSRIVRVSWTNPLFQCDGDLIGRFRKIKSGITLNHSHEVDFMCCE